MKVLKNSSTVKYKRIIENARINHEKRLTRNKYYEKHHVVPRSLGGSDKPTNIVLLTAREHILCHYLLTRMTKGKAKASMIYAYWNMTNGRKRTYQERKMSHRHHERARKLVSSLNTKRQTGISYEEKYGKKRAAEIKAKLSKAHTGKVYSKEYRRKISEAKLGKKFSKQARKNMSIGQKNRTKILCKKCNKSFDPGNYNRYHGNLCKGIIIYNCLNCNTVFNPTNGTAKKFCSRQCSADYNKGGYAHGNGRYQCN